ncbi:GntR family transcriptional regulator [Spiroplasma turonicum]|uniref:Putative sucrose repressor n=1 Tax=Spiroplasma turonicum TaxID=216946 RepID=A0A0K1P688_9MOLU|nr:GntR family transcriptional regulator [Spiroplasma turonicum]AKU79785.1 putative sucrose repressor [Spiroplasma turonicum]ALX70803.1 hypothetical protein STURO_v1c05370 [Spiroplasma turonicum]
MKKWQAIYEYLIGLIHNNIIKDGECLPSENNLKVKFKCSVQPIRKAYFKLKEDKLITSLQGKGYIPYKESTNVLLSFSELFPNAISKYKYLGKISLTKDLKIKTNFLYENFVHKIIVKRFIDNELFIYQISYISDYLLKTIIDIDLINKKGLMHFFNNCLKYKINYSVKQIITLKKEDIKDWNNNIFVNEDNLILDKGMLFTLTQDLVEYRESYYKFKNFKWSFIEYYK